MVKVTDAAGSEEMRYGKLGETVWDRKTIASHTKGRSAHSPEVYTTQYKYDSFARLLVLTLPDGEVLTHSYDEGGNLTSITGVEGAQGANTSTGGMTTNYLQTLLYDKFEQRTYMKLGNGVETHYHYRADNRRLQRLVSGDAAAGTFQDLRYHYDKVGNIKRLRNKVDIPAPGGMGGPTLQHFNYDNLYRLTSASGSYQYAPNKVRNYTLAMSYDDIHNIVNKTQTDNITTNGGKPLPQKATSYDWDYSYGGSQPHAPTHIGGRSFSYDLDGNLTGWRNDKNGTRRTILWDEENRIKEIDDNGDRNYYTYDAGGNRAIKVSRQGETVYVNPYYVVRNRSIVSKHIFAGTSRIATHMEMGNGNTGSHRRFGGGSGGGGSGGNGGGHGHGNNGNAYGHDKVHGQSGESHGNGQDNGNAGNNGNGHGNGNGGNNGHGHNGNGNVESNDASVDTSNLPGNSEKGLENALASGRGHKYGIYKHLAREGDTVVNGEIVPIDGSSSSANTPAGFKKSVNGQSSFTYYYHPDHLGSTGFVTDAHGKLYEHMEYFPFGETWVDEHSNTLRTPYLFTGKEYDQETGLYYFGARYYDPRTSVWVSPDPILGRYLGGNPSGGVFNPSNLGLYSYVQNNPLIYTDPDGKASVSTMIDNAAKGCGTFSCMGYATVKAVYLVGTLGFASWHDQWRDKYDNGEITGKQYAEIGIAGGGAIALTNWFAGKWIGEGVGPVLRWAAGFFSRSAPSLISDLTAEQIGTINKMFSNGRPVYGKDISTVIANASYREGPINQAASIIRDIAGAHLFENGNKRTAQTLVETLFKKAGVKGVSSDQLRSVIDQTAKGNLKDVNDIAHALRSH